MMFPPAMNVSTCLRVRRFASLFLMLGATFGAVAIGQSAAADNKKNSKGLTDDIRRQDQQINEARNKAQSARKQADAARRDLAQAKSAFEREVSQTAELRRSVEGQHDSTPALTAARQQLQQSLAAFEAAAQPVRDKLVRDPAFQSALAKREELKLRLARAGDDQRDAVGREYSAAMTAVRKLEQDLLDADPKVKAARAALTESEGKVQSLVTRRNEAVDRDPKLVEAKSKLGQLKSKLEQAEQKLAGELRQLVAAERKVDQEEQQKRQLQQKQKQQQQQNNKKNNNKKK